MGTEVAIALALAAASAGAEYYNNRQVAKRQDNTLAAQLRAENAKQHQADAETAKLVAKTKASSDSDEKAGALGQFTAALDANRANALRPLMTEGAVSDAYKKAGSDATLGMANKAAGLADLTASIDAPHQQRQNDVRDYDNYQTQIGLIKRANSGDDFLTQMKLRSIQKNPWLSAFSSMAGGASKGVGSGSLYSGGGASAGSNLYTDNSGLTYNLPSY